MKNIYKNIKYLLLIVLFGSYLMYAADTQLEFNNAALNSVLSELSKYYSVNFIYQDKLIEGKKITWSLSNRNLDTAIQEVINISNLAMEKINENTYVLYHKIQSNPFHTNTKKLAPQIKLKKAPILTPPKAISNIYIPYPNIAKIQGFEGAVDMKILINENGNVEMVEIQKSSNSVVLDLAATEYAKKIKFIPAQIDSQSISVWSKWKVVFDLVSSDTSHSKVIFKNIEND